MLRGTRVHSPFYGVHQMADGVPTLIDRCLALQTVIPDGAISHRTAAVLHQLPLPQTMTNDDVDLIVPHGRRAPRGRGVRGHTGLLPSDVGTLKGGLRVVRPPVIWGQLAGALALPDLVALGDVCLRARLATPKQLDDAAHGGRHRRGTRLLTAALPLLDPRAESPMESRVRVLLVLGGLPHPDVNRDVVVDGEWIARPDLSYPAARLAIEYEGDHHRTDRRQWRSDKRRRRLLEDAGWLVIEVTADDVFRHADELIARVRIALLRRI
jgi:very-short-patch-repair endonuclease